jgi:hypothetical protein
MPTRFHLSFLAVLVLAGGLSTQGWGWSSHGHRVVGHLAELELNDTAREQVRELLGDHRNLGDVGPWADWVRDDRSETAPLHYINGPTDEVEPREQDFALDEGNVYSAILGYAERLADDNLSEQQRREALKFLVHFIGDLHQPLHTGFAEDRGGNTIAAVYQGELTSLHRYWDHDLLAPRVAHYSPEAHAGLLHGLFPASQRVEWRRNDDPRDWVIEARGYVFAGLYPLPRTDEPVDEIDGALPVLDEAYRAVWLPVAERQLARAGTRLAATLNAIFESERSPFEPPPIDFPPEAP